MARVEWDKVGERFYEAGVDRGVLYPPNVPGVPWNGLLSVTETTSGAERKSLYLDGVKYANDITGSTFDAKIEAYTYPEEFEPCFGVAHVGRGFFISDQASQPFGFTYRTNLGNDTDGQDYGYKLHLVYGAVAVLSDRNRKTNNDTPEAQTFSWDVATLPISLTGFRMSAHIAINSTKIEPSLLTLLEDILYGSEAITPHLPSVDELTSILEAWSTLLIVDHGDGVWTALGSDSMFTFPTADSFTIASDSAAFVDADTFTIESL